MKIKQYYYEYIVPYSGIPKQPKFNFNLFNSKFDNVYSHNINNLPIGVFNYLNSYIGDTQINLSNFINKENIVESLSFTKT